MKLSSHAPGRDNNFNLLRLLAALSVLATHSFVLPTGSPSSEPLRQSLGVTWGSIAVDVFFVTSGFLVTGSLLVRQSAVDFLWARALRIYPALVVMVSLTVFGLGVAVTSLPIGAYLADSRTYSYLLKSASVVTGVSYSLPGVFEGNPFGNAVNGSLWTLIHELKMYALLVGLWVVLRLTGAHRARALGITIVVAAVVSNAVVLVRYEDYPVQGSFARLFVMFFTGAAYYSLRARITLARSASWLCAAALVASATAGAHVFITIYTVTLPYLVFALAYLPAGPLRKYNRFGDYSYGLYIYAFPVQQSIVALRPSISVPSMIVMSCLLTLPLAVLSWHLIERHALGLKTVSVSRTRRLLRRRAPAADLRERVP